MERELALELVGTMPHADVDETDGLNTPERATAWVRSVSGLLPGAAARTEVDEALRGHMVALRRAVRSLFARAVRPAPPSPVDAHHLVPFDQALERLNAAAARVPVRTRMHWQGQDPPRIEWEPDPHEPAVQLEAALARAGMSFLSGPLLGHLRACTAPRCVRYFVRSHGRQQWCCVSCGNRARAARHYERHGPARI